MKYAEEAQEFPKIQIQTNMNNFFFWDGPKTSHFCH